MTKETAIRQIEFSIEVEQKVHYGVCKIHPEALKLALAALKTEYQKEKESETDRRRQT